MCNKENSEQIGMSYKIKFKFNGTRPMSNKTMPLNHTTEFKIKTLISLAHSHQY